MPAPTKATEVVVDALYEALFAEAIEHGEHCKSRVVLRSTARSEADQYVGDDELDDAEDEVGGAQSKK